MKTDMKEIKINIDSLELINLSCGIKSIDNAVGALRAIRFISTHLDLPWRSLAKRGEADLADFKGDKECECWSAYCEAKAHLELGNSELAALGIRVSLDVDTPLNAAYEAIDKFNPQESNQ